MFWWIWCLCRFSSVFVRCKVVRWFFFMGCIVRSRIYNRIELTMEHVLCLFLCYIKNWLRPLFLRRKFIFGLLFNRVTIKYYGLYVFIWIINFWFVFRFRNKIRIGSGTTLFESIKWTFLLLEVSSWFCGVKLPHLYKFGNGGY